jgi:hypothetical protein
MWLSAACLLLVAAVFGVLRFRPSPAPAHVLVAPQKIGSFVQKPSLAKAMDAAALQQQVVARSAGEAKHVVYAVYQDSQGKSASANPQIVLFIGGNLTGTSASGFIDSFTGQSSGAQKVPAGAQGGSAACLPKAAGGVTECAWADNDTFGVLASPSLSVQALSAELRTARPQTEHLAK